MTEEHRSDRGGAGRWHGWRGGWRTLATILMVAVLATATGTLHARDTSPDRCTRCHDETADYPVLPIYKTAHSAVADERTRFGEAGCTSCHGDSLDHLEDDKFFPEVTFDPERTPPEQQNQACLSCHQSDRQMVHWHGSEHEFAELSCASCHNIHAGHDKVLYTESQPQVCADCHQQQQHELRRPSRHPVADGLMACSDCHQPHGSTHVTLLKQPTVNETCYSCHAGKRGPFLWDHVPVREDCTTCHQPHGSVHRALLEMRPPQLCQQCHLQDTGHAAEFYDGGSLDSFRVGGQSCLNCHSAVHGSNHPRGYILRR